MGKGDSLSTTWFQGLKDWSILHNVPTTSSVTCDIHLLKHKTREFTTDSCPPYQLAAPTLTLELLPTTLTTKRPFFDGPLVDLADLVPGPALSGFFLGLANVIVLSCKTSSKTLYAASTCVVTVHIISRPSGNRRYAYNRTVTYALRPVGTRLVMTSLSAKSSERASACEMCRSGLCWNERGPVCRSTWT